MIRLFFSIFFSLVYWRLSREKEEENKTVRALCKFLSVILLYDETNYYYNLILLAYSIGDVVIIHHEETSLIFFGAGHLLLISYFLDKFSIFASVIIAPFLFNMILSLHTFSESRIIYLIYIYSLTILSVAAIMNYHFGIILMILSDLSIGIQIEHTEPLEWPLYYVNLLCLRRLLV